MLEPVKKYKFTFSKSAPPPQQWPNQGVYVYDPVPDVVVHAKLFKHNRYLAPVRRGPRVKVDHV